MYRPESGRWLTKDHLGNTRVSFKASGNQLIKTAESAFEPWGNRIPIGISNAFQNRWEFQGKTKEATFRLNRVDFGARTMNPITTVWDSVDPLAEKMPSYSPFSFSFNNPLRFIDPDGREPFDWVLGKNGNISWDKNANSQATTKAGETYLGKNLSFKFNSYINNTYDGVRPPWDVTGDKLTSTINVRGNENKGGNLTSIDVKSSYSIGETGGIDMFKGRDYFPGLGADQNKSIDAKGMTGGTATFEQHASVPGLEAFGLNMLGYDIVNVAQKMTVGLSGNNLSVTAGTDVFPSATLSVNGNQLFQYNQPSFTGTHGRNTRTVIGDNGTGGSTTTETTSRRPAPSFHQRYPK